MVTDATGRRVPASLAVEGQAVQLRVDDAGAAYPLTIDPWFEQAKLTASDAAANDEFGGSVAVSGDTAVVGRTARTRSRVRPMCSCARGARGPSSRS